MFAVKYVCLISHETNGLIMIPKTVLKSGLWRCSKKYGFNSNCQENYLTLGSWCGFKSGFAFCKICLPNLARGYLSDHDSENCSEISAVTWSGIFFNFFKILTFVFFTPPYCSLRGEVDECNSLYGSQHEQCLSASAPRRKLKIEKSRAASSLRRRLNFFLFSWSIVRPLQHFTPLPKVLLQIKPSIRRCDVKLSIFTSAPSCTGFYCRLVFDQKRWKYSKFLSCSPNIKGPNMTYSASLFGVNSKLDNMKIILMGAISSNISIQKFGQIRNWGSKKFDAKYNFNSCLHQNLPRK